jgi:putative spermidine/putrescine transport system permease protein
MKRLKIFCTVIFFILVVPPAVIVAGSLTSTGFVSIPPADFSLRWYMAFFASDQFMSSAALSFQVAFASAAIASILGTIMAVCLSRYDFPGRHWVDGFFMLPLMMPLVVVGLAFLLFHTLVGIAGTVLALIIAHVTITTPYVLRMVKANFANFNWNLERAAANLGASPLSVWLHVTMPLVRPGILGGAILAFVVSFDDAVVALFLSGPNAVTLPVRIFNHIEESPGPIVAAAGSLLVLFALAVAVVVDRTVGALNAFGVSADKADGAKGHASAAER